MKTLDLSRWSGDGLLLLLRLLILRSRTPSRPCSSRTWRQWLLLLLEKLLLLDQLLLRDLRSCGDLGSLAVEDDFGLFEIATGI